MFFDDPPHLILFESLPVQIFGRNRDVESRQPGFVVTPREQQRVNGHPTAAQPRPGVQRISPIVAGADQEQHPPPVAAAEEVEHCVGEAGGRALHQGTVRQVPHQFRLGGTNLGGGVGEAHARHATKELRTPPRPGVVRDGATDQPLGIRKT